jgi:hypothetical protein
MIPEAVALAFEGKIILTPGSVFMLVALGLCVAIVWKWARKRI